MEQIDYRLIQNAGCYVRFEAKVAKEQSGLGPEAQALSPTESAADHSLVWLGTGVRDLGLEAGMALDEAGRRAARALADGTHPQTGERLVRAELRAHPRSQLTGAPLVEAVEGAAAARSESPADLFLEKPKQAALWNTLVRMVHQKGERHRLQVGSLHRLARAAGVALEDVYQTDELAEARAHENRRVSVRVRAYDVVADLAKSTSVLWALLGERHEREFRALVHEAKREAFAELEGWIGYGVAGEDGTLHRIATGGLLGWSVEHQSARPVDDTPGDPHLHIHLVIANLARCEDGRWRAVANGGRDLYRHAKAFDGLFKARVRALAYERFGVRYARDLRNGAWEVVGVPDELRIHYSRRSAHVDAVAGADAGRGEKLRVSQRTRHAKHDAGTINMRADWRLRSQRLGVDVDALVASAAPGLSGPDGGFAVGGPDIAPKMPPPETIARRVFDPGHGLTAHEKAFSRAQLLAAVADTCPQGLRAGDLETLTDQVVAVEGYATPLPARGSNVMSSVARYTTCDVLAAERLVSDAVSARLSDGSARLPDAAADAAVGIFEVSAGFRLSDDQRRVVSRLLTAGHGIDVLVADIAGADATAVLAACRIGWDAAGMTCAGAGPTAAAVDRLTDGAGIQTPPLTWWLSRIEEGTGLSGVDVLVVDQVASVGDRTLAVLVTEAARTGTKVIAVGDPVRSGAVGSHGGCGEVHRLVGEQRLVQSGSRRADPTDPTEADEEAGPTEAAGPRRRPPTEASGRRQVLSELADRGYVHAADHAEDARAQILEAWDVVRRRWRDPYDVLANLVLLTADDHDADALNSRAQAMRRDAGELGAEHTYVLPRGRRLTLAVGDPVRVRSVVRERDDGSRLRVGPDILNGHRAQITAIDTGHRVQITWRRTDPNGSMSHHQAWLTSAQVVGGALALGYALTIAASGGLTAEVSLLYGLGANAQSLYPGITRARAENHLWLAATTALEKLLSYPVSDQYVGRGASGSEAEEGGAEGRHPHSRPTAARNAADLLERAIDGCAAYLGQHHTGSVAAASDQLGFSSVPFGIPFPSADDNSLARWDDSTVRPHGRLPFSQLETGVLEAEQSAAETERLADAKAREVTQALREISATPSRGRRFTSAVTALLHTATRHAERAEQETRRAEEAAARTAQARKIHESIAGQSGRNRLALRMAGTSRAEQRRLLAHYADTAATASEEADRAKAAAEETRREAWQIVAGSPYLHYFQNLDPTLDGAPGDLSELRRRLDVMRAQLPLLEQRIDTQLLEDTRHLRARVIELRAQAETRRTDAEDRRLEQALRRQIAERDPVRAAREAAARDAALRQERCSRAGSGRVERPRRIPATAESVPRAQGWGRSGVTG